MIFKVEPMKIYRFEDDKDFSTGKQILINRTALKLFWGRELEYDWVRLRWRAGFYTKKGMEAVAITCESNAKYEQINIGDKSQHLKAAKELIENSFLNVVMNFNEKATGVFKQYTLFELNWDEQANKLIGLIYESHPHQY